MVRTSAGILLYRASGDGLEVFIGHMGGPFWRRRPRSWSIPKGELETGEDPFDAARREFAEEIGVPAPDVEYVELGQFRQASGKQVIVFAAEASTDLAWVRSTTVSMELPRGSGRFVEFPEIDHARWVPVAEANEMLVAGQVPAVSALAELRCSNVPRSTPVPDPPDRPEARPRR
jgi:predicted NUDIX family NTP pyrophosphohydrolase